MATRVIRIFFVARGVASLSSQQTRRQAEDPSHWNLFSCVFHCNQRLTMLFYNNQEGPPLVQKRPPSLDIVMSGGDMCAPYWAFAANSATQVN
jgi:hypothetical protein